MKRKALIPLINRKQLFILIAIITISLVVGGYLYYLYEEKTIQDIKQGELKSIADLKVSRLIRWHKERLGDAQAIYKDSFLSQSISSWLKNKQSKSLKNDFTIKLLPIVGGRGYKDILITSADGKLIFTLNSQVTAIDSLTAVNINEAAVSKQIKFIDYYFCITHNEIHYDIAVPIIDDNKNTLAVLILRIDPEAYLYPLIQSWPIPTRSAETIVLRKSGSGALFLNDSLYQKNPNRLIARSLQGTNLPAEKALLGYTGFLEGTDYRSQKVLSFIEPVPLTNWYIIAKIDKSEIFAELKYRAVVIILFTISLILLSSLGLTLIYRSRQRNIYRELYQKEKELWERKEEFKTALYSIGDCVITTDKSGIIQQLNPTAENLTGWNEEEAKGESIQNVFKIINEDTRLEVENPVERVLREGRIIGLANHTLLISKYGKEIPIADSGAPIRNLEGEIIGVVLVFRDQTEERAAQKKLFESEEHYRALVESSPAGIIALDAEGCIVYENPAMKKIIGVPAGQASRAMGMKMTKMPNVIDAGVVKNIEDVLNGKTVSNVMFTFQSIYGKKTELTFDGVPLKNEAGKITGALFSFENITERRQAEEARQESEEKYRTIIETTETGFLIVDEQGKVLEANAEYIRLSGHQNFNEIKDRNVVEWTSEKDSILNAREIKLCLENGFTRNLIINYKWPDGQTIPVEINATVVGRSGNRRIMTICRDITERRKAEEALIQSNSFNEMLLKTVPFGLDIVDENGKILFLNGVMKQLCGNDAISKSCWLVYKDDKKQCIDCPLRKGIELGRQNTLESTGIFGGKTFLINHVGMIYEGRKAVLEIFQDITEQKKLQQEILQIQKMESIGTLAGGIAHDFNNILGIILAYSTAMQQPTKNKNQISEYSQIINQAVQRGSALVNQILTFARQTDMVLAPVDLVELINELVTMLRQTFPKVITIKEEIDEDVQFITADRSQVHQALLNLFVNARDAMPSGGTILIKVGMQSKEMIREKFSAADQESYLCISVTDTGIGMDEEMRLRIFDPFFTTKEKGKGTGLGLAVVYGVVRTHRGFIEVESQVNYGTTFRLYFPCSNEKMQIGYMPPKEKPFAQGGTETVLFVEDEKAIIEMTSRVLKAKGYKVYAALDGNEAVEKYLKYQNEIDIVISDMGLPGMTGIEVFKKLKSINKEVQVILASGFFEPGIISELEQDGVKGFIQKPYKHEMILKIMRDVLDNKFK